MDNFLPTFLSIFYKFFPELRPTESEAETAAKKETDAYVEFVRNLEELLDDDHANWDMTKSGLYTFVFTHRIHPVRISGHVYFDEKKMDSAAVSVDGVAVKEFYGHGDYRENQILTKIHKIKQTKDKIATNSFYAKAAKSMKNTRS